ncbi:MBL fold metallo-hydrolase [uncultured Bacteroides sp.]|uniref:MBL fold metallo-hydrolase n=1 Tax=uncultured Bacteroides sp. TaxID=162156 RepID=UPI002AAAFF76|nr:MBL fold metallo-hydrolase [uncultured Bacteroides sp.]
MKLRIFGSSSKGNGYAIQAQDGKVLLLEAGVPAAELLRIYNPDQIEGCLISHEHGDHMGRIKDYLQKGIKCVINDSTSQKVIQSLDQYKWSTKMINPKKMLAEGLGKFTFKPFELFHDVPCSGFLILHDELKMPLLFATDTDHIPYTFTDAGTVMIEADYGERKMQENEQSGHLHPGLARRIRESHMSLEKTIKFIKAQTDISKVERIILIHLSESNSDQKEFRDTMQEATGIITYIATPGMEIEIGKNRF